MLSVTGVILRAGCPPCWVRPAVTDRARSGNPSADAFKRRSSIGVLLPYSGYSLGHEARGSEDYGRNCIHASERRPRVNRVWTGFGSHLRGSRTTSTCIALDIRHQPIAERDQRRIVLSKRAVNQIPGLPLGYRQFERRDQAARAK